jgi:uncharacterized protein (DUF305 family)
MSAAVTERPAPPPVARPAARSVASLPVVTALLTVLAALLATGFLLAAQPPLEDSAEVGFARDMSRHHAQAVAMAEVIRDRTPDPELRAFTQDIALTQQAQIGMMTAWLDQWGYSQSGSGPAMAWMGMPTSERMPGMATPAEVAELRTLPLERAEGQFLALMVAHHAGGVAMAEAGATLAEDPQVVALAQGIAAAQASEIDYLQSLREQRGLAPAVVPDVAMAHDLSADHHAGAGVAASDSVLWIVVTLGVVAFFWLLVDSVARRSGASQRRLDDLAVAAAAGGAVSSAVHFALTPAHAAESAAYGLFFVVSAVAMALGVAVVLAGRPVEGALLIGIVSLLLVVTYVVFRIIPAPGADAPEGVDAWGVLAIGAELLALAAAVGLLRRRARIADPA